jgi:hypothetical protein
MNAVTETNTVKLNDGSELFFTDKLHEDETGIVGGVAARLVIQRTEGEGDDAEVFFEDFPGMDEEYSHQEIFDTIQTHERTLALLIEAGHVSQEKVSKARELALKLR